MVNRLPGFIADAVYQTLNMQTYTFAKTMPTIPHYYTVERWWVPGSPLKHREILRAISEYGVIMTWGRKKTRRLYLDVPDPATGITWRYWHMGACSPDAWTDPTVDVINRQDRSINTCKPLIELPPPPDQQTLF